MATRIVGGKCGCRYCDPAGYRLKNPAPVPKAKKGKKAER